MKKIPDFFKILASSKELRKEVLEEVFPRFYQIIELLEKALPIAINQIMQDQELMGKSHFSFYIPLMKISAETHLSMARSNMSCIKSWFEIHQLISDKETAIIESLLETAKEDITSAERTLNGLQDIYERRDIIFLPLSPGSEQAS